MTHTHFTSDRSEVMPVRVATASFPSGFDRFLVQMLKQAGLSSAKISSIMSTPAEVQILSQAFVHSTQDPKWNYERLEFNGDLKVNDAVAAYIEETLPGVVSVQWLTRIKHNIQSKKQLSRWAAEAGFERYIRHRIPEEKWTNTSPKNKLGRDSVLEDCLEAFCGALTLVIRQRYRQKGLRRSAASGVAHAAVEEFLWGFLSQIELSLKYDQVFDAKTMLKEIFDKKHWGSLYGKRPDHRLMNIRTIQPHGFQVTIYGYPLNPGVPIQLGSASGATKLEAQERASAQALQTLASEYSIRVSLPDPYHPDRPFVY